MSGTTSPAACVVALAGRRIDAADAATPRFPLANVDVVSRRIAELLSAQRARALVCSAACGADLIALEAAERLGLERRIVLPFAPERFRATSVTDRPGAWGPVYDRVIMDVRAAGGLVVLDAGEGNEVYAIANRAIVREARSLAERGDLQSRLAALVVWEGRSRGSDDSTDEFRRLAEDAGFTAFSVPTL